MVNTVHTATLQSQGPLRPESNVPWNNELTLHASLYEVELYPSDKHGANCLILTSMEIALSISANEI